MRARRHYNESFRQQALEKVYTRGNDTIEMVADEFTRQGLTMRLGRSLTAHDTTHILEQLFRDHGRPVCIRSDNGPELVSEHVQKWLKET